MSKLFITLPVADLAASTAFYQSLGFTKNDNFSDTHASCMIWDENIYVMLLTHEFTKGFLPEGKTIADAHHTAQVLNALSMNNKSDVDVMFDKAISAGGKKTIATQDHGFMYGRDFEDLDGHIWELFWMDEAAAQG